MKVNLIALAIPFFFLLIGIELWVAKRQRRIVYRFADAIGDLACGVTNQVSAILFGGFLFAGYIWLFDHHRIWDLSSSAIWVWGIGFVAVDFVYYLWHRASHRVNFIWAAHVVHHQSQDYNLAVALRQALFTQFTNTTFFFVLAVVGVPPVVFAVCVSINTLYQFWIHTQTIQTLGPLEWVLNTPSHHRVHHGINPEYIDKNYAGVFITWDRLLGTFAPERATVVYGTVQPFESTNAIWANFILIRDLVVRASQAARLRDRIWIFFAPPEWTPDGLKAIPEVDAKTYVKYEPPRVEGVAPYVTLQFLAISAVLVGLLLFQKQIPVEGHVLGGALILWTSLNFSGILEAKAWATWSERFRLILVPAIAFGFGTVLGRPSSEVIVGAVSFGGFAIAAGFWFGRLESQILAARKNLESVASR